MVNRVPTEEPRAQKRAYASPVLSEFGAVQDLTAGGSGPQPELAYTFFMMCATGPFGDLMKFC
jgi:hypothetical protein